MTALTCDRCKNLIGSGWLYLEAHRNFTGLNPGETEKVKYIHVPGECPKGAKFGPAPS